MNREPLEHLVTGGTVLTMDAGDRVLENAGIAIARDRIVAVDRSDELERRYRAKTVIRAAGHVIMPGLIDSYGHAGHGLVRGLFHPEHGWPAGQLYWHATTPDWWSAEAELAATERLRFGVTTGMSVIGATPPRVDSPLFCIRNAEAYARVGTRAVLGVGPPDPIFSHLPEPWAGGHFENGEWITRTFSHRDTVDNCIELIKDWHGAAEGRVRIALAPPYLFGRHVPHRRLPQRLPTADDAPLIRERAEEMRELADRFGVIVHTHMFKGSVAFALEQFGRAAVEHLLGPDVVIAHANGLAPGEVATVGAAGCGIASVAYTHENLWYGLAPIPALIAAGAKVAISTDGAAPYCSFDLWRELSRTLWNHWTANGDQGVLPPGRALRMVTIEAAEVLGLGHEVGSLEIGKKADVITVDLNQPHLTPAQRLPHLLTHYAVGHDVATVIVDGRVLMREGQILSIDVEDVMAHAREQAQRAFRWIDATPWLGPRT